MKRNTVYLLIALFSFQVKAEPVLLGLHVLLNSLANKYLPGHKPTSFHGPYIGLSYGWKYELNDPYKFSPDSEGTNQGSLGGILGYQFLRTEAWDFSVEVFRNLINFRDETGFEGEDTVDGFGLRMNWGVLTFKLGYAVHGFEGQQNYYDGGYYTGFGIEYVLDRYSVFFELTDYYVGDRDKHLSGFDVGLKYFFDFSNAGT